MPWRGAGWLGRSVGWYIHTWWVSVSGQLAIGIWLVGQNRRTHSVFFFLNLPHMLASSTEGEMGGSMCYMRTLFFVDGGHKTIHVLYMYSLLYTYDYEYETYGIRRRKRNKEEKERCILYWQCKNNKGEEGGMKSMPCQVRVGGINGRRRDECSLSNIMKRERAR